MRQTRQNEEKDKSALESTETERDEVEMDDEAPISLKVYFGNMPDPRVTGRCDQKLIAIIIVAICAVLSRAETWDEVELFGEEHEAWLKQFLDFPNGIPSHDTFRRVFSLLDNLDATIRRDDFCDLIDDHFSGNLDRRSRVNRERIQAGG